ncbi:hypothetical protein C8Q75DRAFT_741898 [Abortiporus biennis]|nr:hypothetical protein C8Q75DRAFT_741898 [Abortiporus biennis]
MASFFSPPYARTSPLDMHRTGYPLSPPETDPDFNGSLQVPVSAPVGLVNNDSESTPANSSGTATEAVTPRQPKRGPTVAYIHSGMRESRERVVQRGVKWLVVVIPPASFAHEHGHLGHTLSSGPPNRLPNGILMPLFPTMGSQLHAIAREFSFPSTAGLCLYFHTVQAGATVTPRISDDTWPVLWGHLFEPRSPPSTPSQLPVGGKIEFDIDLRKARWYDAWLSLGRRDMVDVPISVVPSRPQSVSHWRGDSRTTFIDDQAEEPLETNSLAQQSRRTIGRHVPRKLSLLDRLESTSVRSSSKLVPRNASPPSPFDPAQTVQALPPIVQEDEPHTARRTLDQLVSSWRASASMNASPLAATGQTSLDPINMPNTVALVDTPSPITSQPELNLDDFDWSVSSVGPPDDDDVESSPSWDYYVPSVHMDRRAQGSVCLTPTTCTSFGPVSYDGDWSPVSNIIRLPSPDIAYRQLDDSPPTPSTCTSWGPLSYADSTYQYEYSSRPPSIDLAHRAAFSRPVTPSTATSWGPSTYTNSLYEYDDNSRPPSVDLGHRAVFSRPATPSTATSWGPASYASSSYESDSYTRPPSVDLGHRAVFSRPPTPSTATSWGPPSWPPSPVTPEFVRTPDVGERSFDTQMRDVGLGRPWGQVWPYNRSGQVAVASTSDLSSSNHNPVVASPWPQVWPYNSRHVSDADSNVDETIATPYRQAYPYNLQSHSSQWQQVWPYNARGERPSSDAESNDDQTATPYQHVYPYNLPSQVSQFQEIWPYNAQLESASDVISINEQEHETATPYQHVYPYNLQSRASPWQQVWPYNTRMNAVDGIHDSGLRQATASNYPHLNIYPAVYPHFDLYPMVSASSYEQATNQVDSRAYPYFDIYPSVYPWNLEAIYPSVDLNKREANATAATKSFAARDTSLYPSNLDNIYPTVSSPPAVGGAPDTPRDVIVNELKAHYPVLDIYPLVYPYYLVSLYPPKCSPRFHSESMHGLSIKLPVSYPSLEIYPPVYPWNLTSVYPTQQSSTSSHIDVELCRHYPYLSIYTPVYPFNLEVVYPSLPVLVKSVHISLGSNACTKQSAVAVHPQSNESHTKYSSRIREHSVPPVSLLPPDLQEPQALSPSHRQPSLSDCVQTNLPVQLFNTYPNVNPYPAVYPNIVVYPDSLLSNKKASLSFSVVSRYPAIQLYPPVYPAFDIYPTIAKCTSIDIPTSDAIAVVVKRKQPRFTHQELHRQVFKDELTPPAPRQLPLPPVISQIAPIDRIPSAPSDAVSIPPTVPRSRTRSGTISRRPSLPIPSVSAPTEEPQLGKVPRQLPVPPYTEVAPGPTHPAWSPSARKLPPMAGSISSRRLSSPMLRSTPSAPPFAPLPPVPEPETTNHVSMYTSTSRALPRVSVHGTRDSYPEADGNLNRRVSLPLTPRPLASRRTSAVMDRAKLYEQNLESSPEPPMRLGPTLAQFPAPPKPPLPPLPNSSRPVSKINVSKYPFA